MACSTAVMLGCRRLLGTITGIPSQPTQLGGRWFSGLKKSQGRITVIVSWGNLWGLQISRTYSHKVIGRRIRRHLGPTILHSFNFGYAAFGLGK